MLRVEMFLFPSFNPRKGPDGGQNTRFWLSPHEEE